MFLELALTPQNFFCGILNYSDRQNKWLIKIFGEWGPAWEIANFVKKIDLFGNIEMIAKVYINWAVSTWKLYLCLNTVKSIKLYQNRCEYTQYSWIQLIHLHIVAKIKSLLYHQVFLNLLRYVSVDSNTIQYLLLRPNTFENKQYISFSIHINTAGPVIL